MSYIAYIYKNDIFLIMKRKIPMKQIPLSFNQKQYQKLKDESVSLSVPIASLVRIAVDNYFKNNIKREEGMTND